MAIDGRQSSGILYGALEPPRSPSPPAVEPRLIAVIELVDRRNGDIAEQIQVDVSDAPLPDDWLKIMLRSGGEELVTKHLEGFGRRDAATAEALQRARSSEHRWTGCYFDPKSAKAWCEYKGIDLD